MQKKATNEMKDPKSRIYFKHLLTQILPAKPCFSPFPSTIGC